MSDIYFAPLVPGAGPLAVRTREDVLALLPGWMKRADSMPVTEALADALLDMLLEAQRAGGYAASQADPGRAIEEYLEALGEDRGATRADYEDEDEYRDRLFELPTLASLEAIREAVNAILAPHTDIECRVVESILDRWFVQSSTQAEQDYWHSFIGATPNYPERFYQADVEANGGDYIPNADPPGALIFALKDTAGAVARKGRHFHIIVPDLSYLADRPAFVWGDTAFPRRAEGLPPASDDPRGEAGVGMFAGTTMNPEQAAFVNAHSMTAEAVYRAIGDTVCRIAGHSMRWTLFADPALT